MCLCPLTPSCLSVVERTTLNLGTNKVPFLSLGLSVGNSATSVGPSLTSTGPLVLPASWSLSLSSTRLMKEAGPVCLLHWSVGIHEESGDLWSLNRFHCGDGTLPTPVAVPPRRARALGSGRSSPAIFYWKGGTSNKLWKPQN